MERLNASGYMAISIGSSAIDNNARCCVRMHALNEQQKGQPRGYIMERVIHTGLAYTVPKIRNVGKSEGVNTRYFKRLLQERKLSQAELARRMKIYPSEISRGFTGKRVFTTHETAQLARILEVPHDEILKNLAVDVPQTPQAQGGMVSVVGEIAARGEVLFKAPSEGPKVVPVPPREAVVGLQALRYVGEGLLSGAHLYYRVTNGVAPEAIGRLCVCTLSDGSMLLATPRAGTSRETYTLRDVNGEVLKADAWLMSASPIVWTKFA